MVNLADAGQAKNPAGANNTINYINKIVPRGPVRKAGLGCFWLIRRRLAYPSLDRGGSGAKRLGWGRLRPPPTRLAEFIIGPRFARTRWLATLRRQRGEG